MKLKKLFTAAIALGVACTSLTACSSPVGVPAQNGKSASTGASSNVSLNFYYPVSVGGPLTKIIDQLCVDFTKEHPDVKVNPVYTGSYADTRTKVQTGLKSGNGPDVAIMFSTDLFSLLDMNAIVDVDTVAKNDSKEDTKKLIDDFYPGFMLNTQTQGKTWGIPFQRSTIVLYYNKDAFQEAGLDPEKAPSSWDELVSDAKKLTKPGRYGIEIPSTGYAYWMLQTFTLQQNGKNLMNSDGNQVFFNAPETVKGLTFWKSLADNGVMPKGTIEWATTPTDFLQGKTAMMYHTTGNLTNVKKNAKFKFGVAMLPKKDTYGSPTGGGNFYIFKDKPQANQQAAWEFVKWMTTPERIAQWSINTGYVAPRKSAYETDEMKKYTKDFPYATVARDQLEYAAAELSTHENGKVTKAIEDNIQNVLTGSKSVQQSLDDAQNKAEGYLKPYQK
ncbi:ABC transporter substrate-binding protein [Clostridium sp. W14A]|uniref:ABC transporter substrate-binding protein n=1 Tax=Caproicibacter fermentans TaxID=2576756 RepID=A0A7G8T9Z0_9FIRM|nr:ABC transporter substrate-binding protein [Caproicibacter fermentans]OCN02831.1 ABC transporter substrate-binding protein [Clostridium sp. W14A]QNK40431.1 ABC transporter substrate-binding protein [Caproicibacter fermentans]